MVAMDDKRHPFELADPLALCAVAVAENPGGGTTAVLRPG
jgi:hypothetical protein